VQKTRRTKRAADGGYAPRFLSFLVASSFFRFDGESTFPPTAANTSRWAVWDNFDSEVNMKIKVCPKCGTQNLSTALKCISCGEYLSVDSLMDTESGRLLSETADETKEDTSSTEQRQSPYHSFWGILSCVLPLIILCGVLSNITTQG